MALKDMKNGKVGGNDGIVTESIKYKGSKENIRNYRPIRLLPVLYKSFTKIITTRLPNKLDAAEP